MSGAPLVSFDPQAVVCLPDATPMVRHRAAVCPIFERALAASGSGKCKCGPSDGAGDPSRVRISPAALVLVVALVHRTRERLPPDVLARRSLSGDLPRRGHRPDGLSLASLRFPAFAREVLAMVVLVGVRLSTTPTLSGRTVRSRSPVLASSQ